MVGATVMGTGSLIRNYGVGRIVGEGKMIASIRVASPVVSISMHTTYCVSAITHANKHPGITSYVAK
jgi:hypothetical protein